jgi:uncharacterized lipoprotein YajG
MKIIVAIVVTFAAALLIGCQSQPNTCSISPVINVPPGAFASNGPESTSAHSNSTKNAHDATQQFIFNVTVGGPIAKPIDIAREASATVPLK